MVWLPAEKALGIDVTPVSPYTITKDGKYRLLSKKEGCPDIISNIVQTSCTASCLWRYQFYLIVQIIVSSLDEQLRYIYGVTTAIEIMLTSGKQ
ncbi:MAG: hypothetical protein IPO94_05825 [Saprospiraceae bacterium]|nr:hypothetical protein [Saprospiraceae bacterium]